MVDKFLASISILAFIGFMMVVTKFVNEFDLWIIVILVLILAIIDFVREIRETDRKSRNEAQPATDDTPAPSPPESRSEGGLSGPQ